MTRPIIEADNVCKRYRLGQYNARSLREEAERFFRRRRSNGKADGGSDAPADASEFWALKDVSFSVQPGEVIGIIGRNGAGKSTLLKILSRVTEPTSGEIRIRGRVASLLEVGTGFHPELTGRENVYLNGAILGMTRAEIKAKFDEIVAFAEVERFLDTPVKRYSSGMYVRLAFAVAAHLEPDILLVDEVLAVGDHAFQKKCLGKLRQISKEHGRTVLFVSHDLAAIEGLTKKSILLNGGSLSFFGLTKEAVERYVSQGVSYRGVSPANGRGRYTQLLDLTILDNNLRQIDRYRSDAPLVLDIKVRTDGTRGMSFDVYISNEKGQRIYFYNSAAFDAVDLPTFPGYYNIKCTFNALLLAGGDYTIDIATVFNNLGYDHYASNVARLHIPYFSPAVGSWNFLALDGYGIVAMGLESAIEIRKVDASPLCDASATVP